MINPLRFSISVPQVAQSRLGTTPEIGQYGQDQIVIVFSWYFSLS
jgi:hypothetical protein